MMIKYTLWLFSHLNSAFLESKAVKSQYLSKIDHAIKINSYHNREYISIAHHMRKANQCWLNLVCFSQSKKWQISLEYIYFKTSFRSRDLKSSSKVQQ
jgi:hypothetical protein